MNDNFLFIFRYDRHGVGVNNAVLSHSETAQKSHNSFTQRRSVTSTQYSQPGRPCALANTILKGPILVGVSTDMT